MEIGTNELTRPFRIPRRNAVGENSGDADEKAKRKREPGDSDLRSPLIASASTRKNDSTFHSRIVPPTKRKATPGHRTMAVKKTPTKVTSSGGEVFDKIMGSMVNPPKERKPEVNKDREDSAGPIGTLGGGGGVGGGIGGGVGGSGGVAATLATPRSQQRGLRQLTREELERQHVDNTSCYAFLRKDGLMERLLGHKMLTGRVDSHVALGYLPFDPNDQAPGRKPPNVAPSSAFEDFPKICEPPPVAIAMEERRGPRTPPGSPGRQDNSSLMSSRGVASASPSSPVPPPPPPEEGSTKRTTGSTGLIAEMAQLTQLPHSQLAECLGVELQNAMKQVDQALLLNTLKDALIKVGKKNPESESVNALSGAKEGSVDGVVAPGAPQIVQDQKVAEVPAEISPVVEMDIKSGKSEYDADDPHLLPPPPIAPATPPPSAVAVATSLPPPPTPVAQSAPPLPTALATSLPPPPPAVLQPAPPPPVMENPKLSMPRQAIVMPNTFTAPPPLPFVNKNNGSNPSNNVKNVLPMTVGSEAALDMPMTLSMSGTKQSEDPMQMKMKLPGSMKMSSTRTSQNVIRTIMSALALPQASPQQRVMSLQAPQLPATSLAMATSLPSGGASIPMQIDMSLPPPGSSIVNNAVRADPPVLLDRYGCPLPVPAKRNSVGSGRNPSGSGLAVSLGLGSIQMPIMSSQSSIMSMAGTMTNTMTTSTSFTAALCGHLVRAPPPGFVERRLVEEEEDSADVVDFSWPPANMDDQDEDRGGKKPNGSSKKRGSSATSRHYDAAASPPKFFLSPATPRPSTSLVADSQNSQKTPNHPPRPPYHHQNQLGEGSPGGGNLPPGRRPPQSLMRPVLPPRGMGTPFRPPNFGQMPFKMRGAPPFPLRRPSPPHHRFGGPARYQRPQSFRW